MTDRTPADTRDLADRLRLIANEMTYGRTASTHSDACWQWHESCALHRAADLLDGQPQDRPATCPACNNPLGPFTLWIADYDSQADRITFAADMDDADDYRLEVDVTIEEGEVLVDCVRFVPVGGGRRLPATRLFKRLRLGALQTQLAGEVRRPWVLMQVRRTWADAVMSPARPGRRGRSDLHYAVWAQRYVEALDVVAAHPIRVMLAAELARGPEYHTTESAIQAKVHRARQRGLLTAPPKKGRPGGRLTEKATELLAVPEEGATDE